jgi:hypothetical protein
MRDLQLIRIEGIPLWKSHVLDNIIKFLVIHKHGFKYIPKNSYHSLRNVDAGRNVRFSKFTKYNVSFL